MIEFIIQNMELLGGVLVAVIMIIYAIVTKQWSTLRIAAYQLMLSAERILATEEGQKKFEVVFDQLWELMPAWIKRFVSESTLKKKLQDWYDLAKDMIKTDSGT